MMSSIIVFSKDRPMQLHAYIESLLLFSDVKQNDITILYCQMKKIDYSRVISAFPAVRWVKEKDFHIDLVAAINASNDFIMFGCDDVVFTGSFNLEFSKYVLSKNDDIFGFSFRLGNNIQPYPKSILSTSEYLKWNWQTADALHYNYPWELDCTLYRKADIQKMLGEYSSLIKSPNYFEGDFAENAIKYISRPNLACLNERSKAIVITVNTVQDTHQNGFDSSKKTDIYSLENLYNMQNNKLDIKAISKIRSHAIHVGSEYFILEKYEKSWERLDINKLKLKKINRLKLFAKNLGYLFRYDLKKLAKQSISRDELHLILDGMKYEIADDFKTLKKPNIRSSEETIDELVQKKASFCRFGDGEFSLMGGQSIAFQQSDPKLSRRLREIFQSNINDIFIGIPHCYYSSTQDMRVFQKNFIRSWVAQNRDKITELSLSGKQYYDTACTQLYALYEIYDFRNYFTQIQEIWRNRDIAIICGSTVFDEIENNIFDCAGSVEYQHAPSINAFEVYEEVLLRAQLIDKNKLVIIILGPTATVLAYDLAKDGYQALDFGHIAKDYDFFCKRIEHNEQTISNFFQPD